MFALLAWSGAIAINIIGTWGRVGEGGVGTPIPLLRLIKSLFGLIWAY